MRGNESQHFWHRISLDTTVWGGHEEIRKFELKREDINLKLPTRDMAQDHSDGMQYVRQTCPQPRCMRVVNLLLGLEDINLNIAETKYGPVRFYLAAERGYWRAPKFLRERDDISIQTMPTPNMA